MQPSIETGFAANLNRGKNSSAAKNRNRGRSGDRRTPKKMDSQALQRKMFDFDEAKKDAEGGVTFN